MNQITDNRLSGNEIIFIKTLAIKEFKSIEHCENPRLKARINSICNKLNVCSFEEVLRKLLFYNLIDIDLPDNYSEYIEKYSRELISTTCTLRNTLLDAGKNVSEVFADFCSVSILWQDKDFKQEVKKSFDKVKEDIESNRLFNNIQAFINIVNTKYDFEQIFNTVFDLDDFEYENDAEHVVEIFNSLAVKYIYIVRILMENSFPLCLKREITPKEKDLINFLLYKGDEIDYMKQYNLAPLLFNDRLNNLIRVYSSDTIQEMLLKAKMEETLSNSSLIAQTLPLHLRAAVFLKNRDKVIKKTPKDKTEQVKELLKAIEQTRNPDFIYGGKTLSEYLKQTEGFSDCFFTIDNKADALIAWFEKHVMPMLQIRHLQYIMAELEQIVPYDKITEIDNS